MTTYRAGYVGLIGRPNSGKSTLLNQILQEKIAITSARPQTTRNRVLGIHTTDDSQLVLVDTPGIHRAWNPLNASMVRAAIDTLQDVDVICWLVDAAHAAHRRGKGAMAPRSDEKEILARIQEVAGPPGQGVPVILAFNKIDTLSPPQLLPLIDAWRGMLDFEAVVPISALKGDGVSTLLQQIGRLLPEQPPLFPADQIADQSERFIVAEIIREKVFQLTTREIPYSTAVEIELFDEQKRDTEDPRVHICARIVLERKSQKGIVIGHKGEMIKRIGTRARHDIQRLLGARVHLELFVAVEKEWTRNPRLRREFGYE